MCAQGRKLRRRDTRRQCRATHVANCVASSFYALYHFTTIAIASAARPVYSDAPGQRRWIYLLASLHTAVMRITCLFSHDLRQMIPDSNDNGTMDDIGCGYWIGRSVWSASDVPPRGIGMLASPADSADSQPVVSNWSKSCKPLIAASSRSASASRGRGIEWPSKFPASGCASPSILVVVRFSHASNSDEACRAMKTTWGPWPCSPEVAGDP